MSDQVSAGLSAAKRELLAQRLSGYSPGERRVRPAPAKRAVGSASAPLSPEQEQLWYFAELAPGNPVYNESISIRKQGSFDPDAFRAAFNELVRRHEIWRTTFEVVGGEPCQVVHPAPAYELPLLDLTSFAGAEAEAERRAGEEAKRPYDLARGPLLRPLLVRLQDDHHRLYLAMHHLIFDGVSLYRVILPELIALYDAYRLGLPSPLAEPELQYSDYAIWARSDVAVEERRRSLGYWQRTLAGADAAQLPLDHRRPLQPTFQGSTEPLELSRELAARLELVRSQVGGTLFQLAAAGFALLLSRYAGSEEVVFGVSADLRGPGGTGSMVGYCSTPLVIRVDLSRAATFRQLLEQVRLVVLEALEHKLPFQELVAELNPGRDPGANPFFQALVTLEPQVLSPDPNWSLHLMETGLAGTIGHSKFDMHLELDPRPEGHISGRIIYNRELFDRDTIKRLGERFLLLLERVTANPEQPIGVLDLILPQERRVLDRLRAVGPRQQVEQRLHERFSQRARLTPEAIAVSCGPVHLTYAELDRSSSQLAHHLRAGGVGRETMVAIYLERSPLLATAILGVLKAGGAYVPIDPLNPPARVAYLLQDSGCPMVLTEGSLGESIPALDIKKVMVETAICESRQIDPDLPLPSGDPSDLAYVIYTSGSTGHQKGVLVEHGNVVRLFDTTQKEFQFSESDVWTMLHSYAFDFSVWEMWGAWLHGGRLVVVPREVAQSADDLRRLLVGERVTVLNQTPSAFAELIKADSLKSESPGLSLRLVIFGGEALDFRILRPWFQRHGERTPQLVNMYGITEATVHATWRTLSAADCELSSSVIGQPLPDVSAYVLTGGTGGREELSEAPPGVVGELWLGGPGVARGYLNRPDLTAERFVPDPIADSPGCLYRTGDLVRVGMDGDLEFIGRRDTQVKIRGYRIELGEVEAALESHPRVTRAAVVARPNPLGELALAGYIVIDPDGDSLEIQEVKDFLSARLPTYLVPGTLMTVDSIPLTINGKLDPAALPTPEIVRSEFSAPTTHLERRLAADFASTLGLERVGVDEDFFQLGGHSLLAARLLRKVEEDSAVKLSLATFFAGPATVARLAEAVEAAWRRGGESDAAGSERLPSQRPALFFIQPDEPVMLSLRHFVGPLGKDYRLVGLLPERKGRMFDRSGSVRGLAETMLGVIRAEQPQGPYALAGFSLGGLIAYEIASLLLAAGEAVAWLGILDTAVGAASYQRRLWRYSPRGIAIRVRQLGLGASVAAARKVVLRGIKTRVLRQPLAADEFDYRGAMTVAARYSAGGHSAVLDLFTSADNVEETGSASLGWEEVHQGRIRIHALPGRHQELLTEPNVTRVARLLRDSLAEAWEQAAADRT